MELANIEKLLASYFEGNTTLAEEATLRSYFENNDVAPQLMVYKPLFEGLSQASAEVFDKEVSLPSESGIQFNRWWYGIAAMLVVGLTVGSIFFSQPGLSQEEKEALAAFEQTKTTLKLLSENLNKGAGELAHLNEFTKGATNIALVNQFTESKNKILK